jgi:hypothetical protein
VSFPRSVHDGPFDKLLSRSVVRVGDEGLPELADPSIQLRSSAVGQVVRRSA